MLRRFRCSKVRTASCPDFAARRRTESLHERGFLALRDDFLSFTNGDFLSCGTISFPSRTGISCLAGRFLFFHERGFLALRDDFFSFTNGDLLPYTVLFFMNCNILLCITRSAIPIFSATPFTTGDFLHCAALHFLRRRRDRRKQLPKNEQRGGVIQPEQHEDSELRANEKNHINKTRSFHPAAVRAGVGGSVFC